MVIEPIVIVAVLGLLGGPAAAAYVAWILNRRKMDNDISVSIAAASGDAVEAIRLVMDSLQDELKETQYELQAFKEQNQDLETSLRELAKQNENLIQENKNLANEIAELREQINRLAERR